MKGKETFYAVWLSLLGLGILIGLVTAFRLMTEGHALFNANDVILWTLPLAAYVFFALTSSGLTMVASIPLVLDITRFQPLAKRLIFLAIATVVAAFICIGLELGSLLHLVYIFLSPNPASPIWWMGTIYSIELVVLLLKFRQMHGNDRHSKSGKGLAIVSFLCAIFGALVLGSVFGVTEARPTFFGSFMSVYCLTIAFLSGLSAAILYGMVYHNLADGKIREFEMPLYDELAHIFLYATGIALLFYVLKLALGTASTLPEFTTKIHFELLLALIIPYVLMLIPAIRHSTGGKIASTAIALAALLGMHMEILLAGQARPLGPKAEGLPEMLSYSPSVWEWFVLVLATSVMLLLYTLGERYLNLDASSPEAV